MKNKLFYFFGAAFLLCSVSMFTSCSSDDDPVVDPPIDNPGGGDDESYQWEVSGEYFEGNKNALKMSYNGEELKGKKVIITTDKEKKTASIVLKGIETDFLIFKLTPSSPIPGEKEIKLEKVELTHGENGTFLFEGEDKTATRTMTYKGTIKEGEISIDIKNTLDNQELAGTWNLAPIDNMQGCNNNSPLWIDWDSYVEIDPGEIPNGDKVITGLNQSPNSLFTLLFFVGEDVFAEAYGFELKIEQTIKNILQSVTAQPNGSMFATYSYSGDLTKPEWSSEMSHNIIRYYYGEEPGQIYVEVNSDFILSAIGGLLTKTRANEQDIIESIQPLIDILKPALEKGFPCKYELKNNKMKINLDGEFTLKLLKELTTLLNTPSINELIMSFITENETLAPYATNVDKLLKSLPNALTYKGSEGSPNDLSGECTFVKVGLQLVKAAE